MPDALTRPFELRGSAARLWDAVADVAERAPREQAELFAGLEPAQRPRLIAALARFERAGALEVHDEVGRRVLGRPLNTLHLELTHRCNLACRACYLGPALVPAGRPARLPEGTTRQWLAVVGQAAELGCTSAVVTGGEPFVRRDALDIVAELRRHGVRCEVNTNGTCVTAAVAERLFELGVWGVEVSLYGYDGDSAAAYTGLRAGHAAALRGVRLLAEHGVPVQAKYFATAFTLDGYEDVRRALEPWGVPLICKGHAIHADIFAGRMPEGVRPPLEVPELVQENALPCTPGIDGLVVEPGGLTRACPKLGLRFGNAFEDGLAAVWNSAQLRAFRPFWGEYCRAEGFVRGARVRNRCPAAAMLSRPDGLRAFEDRWSAWREAH